jgi:hypothetical protein
MAYGFRRIRVLRVMNAQFVRMLTISKSNAAIRCGLQRPCFRCVQRRSAWIRRNNDMDILATCAWITANQHLGGHTERFAYCASLASIAGRER